MVHFLGNWNQIAAWFRNDNRLTAALITLCLAVGAPFAMADDGELSLEGRGPSDRSAELMAMDAMLSDVVSSGPGTKVTKNLATRGVGSRPAPGATTDVWAHNGYAYTGTFSNPCGGDAEAEAGIWIWDVHNKKKPNLETIIPSPAGSRANDVKVAAMNSGDILVHSNESCGGGPGGFEIYNVDNPYGPIHLASVRIDELNPISNALFGGIVDVGVHNLFLFKQGNKDYVAAVAETAFDNFQIFDISDPMTPALVSAWGAEEIFDPGVGEETVNVGRVLDAALWLTDGFGVSANRFLHDVTITADGTRAYLANWDAGLVLLDISDATNPALVSVALDPANGSLDGEVNSHAVWPSEDGSIVIEGEEDFRAWESSIPPGNLTLVSTFPGDPTIPATALSTIAGDDFEASQTGNSGTVDGSSVTVNSGPLAGNKYPASELATAAGSPTFADTGALSGELVWIGRACAGDIILNPGVFDPGDIAVVRRGACFFEDKAFNAAALGAAAMIVTNNDPTATPWSGFRIWDYADSANPVLASTFNTTCSASTAPVNGCDLGGTYSAHNVIVETTGNKIKAYISWYSDGILVLDITDPYNPVETARYQADGENYWGIYKTPGQPWIYASDRNGGLRILKEYGSGSKKKKKK